MSDEQERLAKNINSGIDTASGCAGCGGAVLLLAALPMVAIAAWAVVGSTLGDWAGTVAGIAAAVWVIVTAARLAGWGR